MDLGESLIKPYNHYKGCGAIFSPMKFSRNSEYAEGKFRVSRKAAEALTRRRTITDILLIHKSQGSLIFDFGVCVLSDAHPDKVILSCKL